jgi:outer membrane immunogenic protein
MVRTSALVSLIAAVGTTLGSCASLAADMPRSYTKAPPVYQAPPSWSECYLGGNVGAGRDKTYSLGTEFAGTTFIPPFDYGGSSGSAVIGGGQIGCDYQFASNWVIGIQGKADFGKIASSNAVAPFPGITASYQLKNTEEVTARLGYAVSPAVLAYVKGGVAFANASASASALPVLAETASFTRTGYTVGGGLEWKFAPGWSVVGEYNYLDFGTKSSNLYATGLIPAFGTAGALADTISLRLRSQEALVGVNYRFDWANPVAAKY